MERDKISSFLVSFFALFKAHIENFKIIDNKVVGAIGWKDENEKQSFSWEIQFDEPILLKLKSLCDYLSNNNLIQGDKIIIPESKLKTKLTELNWSLEEIEKNINYICSVEVKMIDDKEETDSFFIHF